MAQVTGTVSSTTDVFSAVREMAIEFRFMPGAKINETELAEELGVSRTPIREALNRLVTEDLIDFRKNYGFFCRTLDLEDVLHLAEAYKTFHLSILPIVFARAGKEEVEALLASTQQMAAHGNDMPPCEMARADQAFLHDITMLTKNPVMVQINGSISARIRFLRKVMLEGYVCKRAYFRNQQSVLELILAGDEQEATRVFSDYLTIDASEAEKALARGLGRIYLKTAH
ncbi:GntR family transcriptional regulator [Cohaesibacter haloalkalitolerans]|uniref:GntR family transcriptional regulator n=1 Tax=Cohaesibacter haloalkalitolerans TaxID=1162980 RepID=UPI000E65BD1B|nr:GntR family transcriptional regulator [Cohaesibacter haloalkalitolerans]